jgi:phosphate/sulfate permease
MIKRYQHTQVGYVIIVGIVAAMVGIGIILAKEGINWIAVAVLGVLAAVLVLFHSLTVVINEKELVVQFGPGAIRKRFKLNEIESVQAVRVPWYYGWGIRATPQGMAFRVSGFDAVHVKLSTGKECLIGTDVPHELEQAMEQALGYRRGLPQDIF